MNGVINLKNQKMIFEKNSLRIVVPLDLSKGVHYTERMCDDEINEDLDHIYKITARDQDWVNLPVEGRIPWECVEACISDSDEEDK